MFSDRLGRVVVFLGTTAALLAVNQMSLAAQVTGGIVTVYHLNPAITGRGACIQTLPALQGTWACVYSGNNPLYKEMNDLLLEAYIAGGSGGFSQTRCTIVYETSDYRIDYAECFFVIP